ncbi:hypothetical protein LTR16_010728, partial [Cryomyces antarcticus]
GERDSKTMGRHATSLGLHFLRKDAPRSDRSQDPPHRTAHESAPQPRTDVRSHVRALQLRRRLRRHSSRARPIRARSLLRRGGGQRRRRDAHRAGIRVHSAEPPDTATGRSGAGRDTQPDLSPTTARLRAQPNRRLRD